MRTTPALAGVAAAALLAAGCGGGRHACLANGGTGAVTRDAGPGTAYLTGVSVARPGCSDRVRLTFKGKLPGYRVEYRPARSAQVEDASGRHIPVAGAAFLVVRLAGAATARSDGSTLTKTYDGPRRVRGDARHVREVVKTGDFEAVVTWAIGLDEKRPFEVKAAGSSLLIEIG